MAQLREAISLAQQNQQLIQSVYDKEQLIAQVYELGQVTCTEASQGHQWKHRHILVKSVQLAERHSANLKKRIKKAQQEILERFLPKKGRKIFAEIQEAKAFVDQVLKRRKVKKYLAVHYELLYDDQRHRKIVKCRLQVQKDKLKQAIEQMGWRVYATNCPSSQLDCKEVVQVYRRQYRIEQNFHQLLNKITQLMPIFLSKQNRIKNLIQLLVLALKFSAIIQYKVRQTLANTDQYLTGLIPYNPGQKIKAPTTYRLLQAFKNLKLFIIERQGKDPTFQLEPLQDLQLTILKLLEIPKKVYLHPCQRT